MGCGVSKEKELNKPQLENIISVNQEYSYRRTDNEINYIELTEPIVEQYVQLEKEIYRLEKNNLTKNYADKIRVADELKKGVDHLQATYKELKKQTDKEKAGMDNIDQPPVRTFLKQQGTYEQKFNREHQAYLDSYHKQELAQKELQVAAMRYDKAVSVAELYKKKSDQLNEYYEMQERLFAGIFAGKYASDLECRLENQLDEALEWQQRVSLAKFKWTNARVLVVHACAQMAFGIKRWKELDFIELNNTRVRYFVAAEARNNFIAAGQNIQSCRVYLDRVQFPYCTEHQMQEMVKSLNEAFSDIQAKDRYRKSLSIYDNVHRQVAALIQWFDQVLNETILPDLEKANNEVISLQQRLRLERLQLITAKVKEHFGRNLQIDYDDIQPFDDSGDDQLMDLEKTDGSELMELEQEIYDVDRLPVEKMTKLSPQPSTRPITPVPPGKLAPVPSNETLFGNIDDLRRQHELERRELEKQMTLAKAKMDQGLQEKLQQRRNRKERRGSQPTVEAPNPTFE